MMVSVAELIERLEKAEGANFAPLQKEKNMSEIPADIMAAALEAHEAQIAADIDDEPLIIARAILAERQRCINVVIDAANAGKYTPLSELACAIRGDATEREAME
ncbi:hypothetical protein [Sinorhizobium meliloti]|uniref:hypothetical protein n=1 Tax=Rhizobium meliloti TaxID=382 RepID=UPI000FDB687D|nr:hypothetical protein [Sinorhizobium meliloti]RVI91789.1 hypothetical protein CN190_03330 [Sinorhizobium meliloti]